MRIIFDYDDDDDKDLMEIQLTEDEIKSLLSYEPIEKDVDNELGSKTKLNVYIRRIVYATKKRHKPEDNKQEH